MGNKNDSSLTLEEVNDKLLKASDEVLLDLSIKILDYLNIKDISVERILSMLKQDKSKEAWTLMLSKYYLSIENDYSKKRTVLSLNLIRLIRIKRSYNGTSGTSLVKFFAVIVPKTCREEFVSDISEMINDWKIQNMPIPIRVVQLTLHLISVVYHGLFFKLQGYFYKDEKKEVVK